MNPLYTKGLDPFSTENRVTLFGNGSRPTQALVPPLERGHEFPPTFNTRNANRKDANVKSEERAKVERYLQTRFANKQIQVRVRPSKDDSSEIYIGDEFAGVLSKDDEEGELCYHFTMTILDLDLEDS